MYPPSVKKVKPVEIARSHHCWVASSLPAPFAAPSCPARGELQVAAAVSCLWACPDPHLPPRSMLVEVPYLELMLLLFRRQIMAAETQNLNQVRYVRYK